MNIQQLRGVAIFITVGVICLATIGLILYRRAANRGNNVTVASAAATAPRKLVIIWWDITKSLYASEQDVGLDWGLTVVANLPADSTYYLFPVNSETQRPTPLDYGQKPATDSPEARLLFTRDLKKRVKENVDRLKRQIHEDEQAAKNYGGVIQRDKRTCLLHALSYSGTLLQNHPKDLQVEILFISDMIEDCFHQTQNHGKGAFIQLTQVDVEPEMKAAAAIPLNAQLKDAWVTVVVPTASLETPVPPRPDMNRLQEFWRAIFERCGVNSERYQWAVGVLPQRLNTS